MPERAPASLDRLLWAVYATIQSPTAPETIARDPRGWLAAQGVQGRDLEAMGALSPARLLFYRKLVRRALGQAIRAEIPRTAARLGSAFAPYLERFLDAELSRSHYLRDVAFEFVGWVKPTWGADQAVPPWLHDLARHELLTFEVASAPDRPAPRASGQLSLDRGLVFGAAARIVRYEFAVHRLSAEEDARDEPAREPTALLAYRDPDGDVRYLALSPLAARIMERLLAGHTLGAALTGACAEEGCPLTEAVALGASSVLADLGERGVLVGVASEPSSLEPA